MINLKFAEAREELETAMDAKETVYFDEEAECARDAANEVLSMYDTLLGKLPETKKGVVQRSMGLKMEQLKAEVKQLED
ncbi:Embryogenesis-like protein [Linum grandiflorum]